MANWYYKCAGEEVGPLSQEELKSHAETGKIQPDTQVRKGNSEKWFVAQNIKGLIDKNENPKSMNLEFIEVQDNTPKKIVGFNNEVNSWKIAFGLLASFLTVGFICYLVISPTKVAQSEDWIGEYSEEMSVKSAERFIANIMGSTIACEFENMKVTNLLPHSSDGNILLVEIRGNIHWKQEGYNDKYSKSIIYTAYYFKNTNKEIVLHIFFNRSQIFTHPANKYQNRELLNGM